MRIEEINQEAFNKAFGYLGKEIPNNRNTKYYKVEELAGFAVDKDTGEMSEYNSKILELTDKSYYNLFATIAPVFENRFIYDEESHTQGLYSIEEQVNNDYKKAKRFRRVVSLVPILLLLLAVGVILITRG